MGMLLEFLAKVTIAIGNAGVGYLMLTEVDQFKNKTDNPWLPIVVIFIISYVMAVMFMSIFSVTSMTLLQCLYVDFDFVKHKGLYYYQNENRPREMMRIVDHITYNQ